VIICATGLKILCDSKFHRKKKEEKKRNTTIRIICRIRIVFSLITEPGLVLKELDFLQYIFTIFSAIIIITLPTIFRY